MNSLYLTTPIYYVNAKPHLGHAYTTIVADAITRFYRVMGHDAMFITGTDEHGDKIVQAAEKAGQAPQVFVDSVSKEFQELWPRLGITPGRFIRTTDKAHIAIVQAFLQRVYDAGDIYYGEYGGHYCYGCERFYTEKELENELCPQHLTKPEYISEKNYFFRMSKYQDWLKQHIQENPDFIRPERYRNEALAILDSGALEDLCISRPKTRLTWGIELPFDANYVCYVWFDALLSYLSVLGGPSDKGFNARWAGAQHLVAKDILKPHALFWPTMLKAGGVPLFRHLNVHGYWLSRDSKMSKSLGNVVAPLDMATRYGNDAFRYFLLRDMHFGSDANFSEEALVARINADLANDLGNLFSRVLSMTAKYRASLVPAAKEDTPLEIAIKELALESCRNYQTLFENIRFSAAIEALWELVRALNKYVDTAAPWVLAKNNEQERLDTVLYTMLECMRKVAIHIWPVMPERSERMLEQLGFSVSSVDSVLYIDGVLAALPGELEQFGLLQAGKAIAASSNLFPRIEPLEAQDRTVPSSPKAKSGEGKQPNPKEKPMTANDQTALPLIEFADFQKIDLRIGTVTECERHPNADKLLRVMVDIGEAAPRQILAGIAAYFDPAALVGKQVTIVANLAPRMMRGLESQGMILAVHSEGALALVTASSGVVPGSKVS